MFVIETKNYREMSKRASEIVIDEVLKKKNSVIMLPTGNTPIEMYKNLAKADKSKKVDFSKTIFFNLDEYYPIKENNENSYCYYLNKNFFDKINPKKVNINLLNGEAENPAKECRVYENKIKRKKIDLVILGVGVNGHIGFNEPGSSFSSKTRVVRLSDNTRKINSRFFKNSDNVPKKAMTAGIGTILSCKKILVLACGKEKALAVKKLVNGSVDKDWPVTALRKHKNLIIIIDKSAGSLLNRS